MSALFINDLPVELIWAIVGKLQPVSYARLHQTCKETHNLLMRRKNLIKLNAWHTVVNIVNSKRNFLSTINYTEHKEELACFKVMCDSLTIAQVLDSEAISKLQEMARETQMKCAVLSSAQKVLASHQQFADFLEAIEPQNIVLYSCIRSAVIPAAVFNKSKRIALMDTDYGDADLLRLSRTSFIEGTFSNVTSKGIRHMLEQWFLDDRPIIKIFLESSQLFSADIIVQDLPVNLLYNMANHDMSIISQLDVADLPEDLLENSYYIIWKPANISYPFLLAIGKSFVQVNPVERPVEVLLELLLPREYAIVTGYCKICGVEFIDCLCDCEDDVFDILTDPE